MTSWTPADAEALAHLTECDNPAWMGELASRATAHIASLTTALNEAAKELGARECLAALEKGSGRTPTQEKGPDDAPPHYTSAEAIAWADGFNSARATPAPEAPNGR